MTIAAGLRQLPALAGPGSSLSARLCRCMAQAPPAPGPSRGVSCNRDTLRRAGTASWFKLPCSESLSRILPSHCTGSQFWQDQFSGSEQFSELKASSWPHWHFEPTSSKSAWHPERTAAEVLVRTQASTELQLSQFKRVSLSAPAADCPGGDS